VTTDMSPYGDTDPMSPYGVIGDGRVTLWPDGKVTLEDDLWLACACCCRDWPVMLGVKIGHCGYCGEVPVVVGPWTNVTAMPRRGA